MNTIHNLLARLGFQLGTELYIQWSDDLAGWAVIDSAGHQVLVADSDWELLDGLLGSLEEEAPDLIDEHFENLR